MPERINKVIELLARDQPVYYTGPSSRGYEGGKKDAQTWADYINYDFEHGPFDMTVLREYMRGLVDGGPTKSGHRTPAVVVTLPMTGTSEATMRANSWQIAHVLSAGVHGMLLCHAEDPAGVRAFVESARWAFQTPGVGEGQLGVGRMGNGGQGYAAGSGGWSRGTYMHKADPWPLNPEGELFLGLKIENKRALANTEAPGRPGDRLRRVGPGDMGLSLGFVDRHDPPYPPEMQAARARVLAGCKANNVAFLNQTRPPDVVDMIAEGVRVGVRGPGGRGDRAPAHRPHHALVAGVLSPGGRSPPHPHTGAPCSRRRRMIHLLHCGGLRPPEHAPYGGVGSDLSICSSRQRGSRSSRGSGAGETAPPVPAGRSTTRSPSPPARTTRAPACCPGSTSPGPVG